MLDANGSGRGNRWARRAILSGVQTNFVGQIGYFYGSFCGAGVGKDYFHIICEAESGFNFIGPFYEDNGVPGAEVVEADGFEIGGRIEAVGVDVVNVESAVILVDEDEGRAGDGAGTVFCAAACGNSFYEVRLSASEGPGEGEYFTAGQLLSYGAPEGDGFSRRICEGFEFHVLNAAL